MRKCILNLKNMKRKITKHLLLALLSVLLLVGCSNNPNNLKVVYLREGKLAEMMIPLNIVKSKTELSSLYIDNIKCSILDSTTYMNSNPDEKVIYSTPVEIDYTKRIKNHSPEYYSIYTVYCINHVIDYYNRLFDNRINFNSQEEYKNIEVTIGDVPFLTTPDSYIFEKGANPSPSVFYHEIGHRAFWYIEDELGIKFNGLSYIHMGLLEYFTVSLNDSPVIGEDALPEKMVRNANWLYCYPPSDSLSLGKSLEALKNSYPTKMNVQRVT